MATKLMEVQEGAFKRRVLVRWFQEANKPCPTVGFMHVDPLARLESVNALLRRVEGSKRVLFAQVLFVHWKLYAKSRSALVERQAEMCAVMTDERQRRSLTLSFHNWLRLLDDSRMGKAAARIKSDSESLIVTRYKLDKEQMHTDRIIDLLGGILSDSECKNYISRSFYHWLTLSLRRSPTTVVKRDPMEFLPIPVFHETDVSIRPALGVERMFEAPAWPSPFDILPKVVRERLPPINSTYSLVSAEEDKHVAPAKQSVVRGPVKVLEEESKASVQKQAVNTKKTEESQSSEEASVQESRSSFKSQDEAKNPFKSQDEAKSSFKSPDEAKSSSKFQDEAKSSFKSPDEAKNSFKSQDEAKSSSKFQDEAKSSFKSQDEAKSSFKSPNVENEKSSSSSKKKQSSSEGGLSSGGSSSRQISQKSSQLSSKRSSAIQSREDSGFGLISNAGNLISQTDLQPSPIIFVRDELDEQPREEPEESIEAARPAENQVYQSIMKKSMVPGVQRKLTKRLSTVFGETLQKAASSIDPVRDELSSSSSSSSSSSPSSSSSSFSEPIFKLSMGFFIRMRAVVRRWAARARETVARRRQETAVTAAVEKVMQSWRPDKVPAEIQAAIPLAEAMRIFRDGALLMKRKGTVSEIGVSGSLFGGLKDQSRYFVGRMDDLEKFLVYYESKDALQRGSPPSGWFSLDELRLAQFSWNRREMGIFSSQASGMKKISKIPDYFFKALLVCVRNAIGVQVRRNSGVTGLLGSLKLPETNSRRISISN